MENPVSKPFLNIPVAILIAAVVISIAIIWTKKPVAVATTGTSQSAAALNSTETANIPPVTADDHILGNPNAPIKIVEYSDPSCPYCKMFNATMNQIMNQYGSGGQVAWVYRSFPLDKPGTADDGGILHPNAGHEAQALECAGSLGGNDKFWAYTNLLYSTTPSVTPQTPNGLDQNQLPVFAVKVGLDKQAFVDCLSSGKFADKIEAQYQDGLNAGITGTPFSFIVTSSGTQVPVPGGQPFSTLKSAIDTILQSMPQSSASPTN